MAPRVALQRVRSRVALELTAGYLGKPGQTVLFLISCFPEIL